MARGEIGAAAEGGPPLTTPELDVLIGGFIRIRNQEHPEDVADWANAVIAVLEDEPGARR